jgi:hypothetical protein
MKKVMLILFAVIFAASTAWAGNIPEYDTAIDIDANNIFAVTNLAQYGQVTNNNLEGGIAINIRSANVPPPNGMAPLPVEHWYQWAGIPKADPCFPFLGFLSSLTDAYNQGVYEWYIILQMKPESDINLNIYDCVLKHNQQPPLGPGLWGAAEQTGRYRADWGQLFFIPTANPSVTVKAYPGYYATPLFTAPFTMDMRTLPGLSIVAADNVLYTSKALWSEGLVLVMPETGKTNAGGATTYNLKEGDRIKVTITIPFNNTCDIRYGADSVILKYIGVVGTGYWL